MELTPEQRAVMNVFKEHKITKGDYLAISILNEERAKLSKNVRDHWEAIIKSLMESGYITRRDPLGYGLTEMGSKQIQEMQ